MIRKLAERAAMLAVVVVIVSFATFMMVELVPGDAASHVAGASAGAGGGSASAAEDYARVRNELGLDRPLLSRYLDWVGDALRGDFGRNLVDPVQDVSSIIARALPVNLELAFLALVIALGVSIPLALWTTARPGRLLDRLVSAGSFALIALPSFLVAVLLLLLFAIHWHVFPTGQWVRPTEGGWLENLRYAFLPAITLALSEVAVFTRLLRRDLAATMREDFISVARAKGMPMRHIMFREALRPSSFSLLTLAGISAGRLLGGSVIVERVYSLPGLGSVLVDAVHSSDYPVVQAGVLVVALVYVSLNLGVDVLYAALDPRVRRARH
jgi:peptide/nickel transport system permease protein